MIIQVLEDVRQYKFPCKFETMLPDQVHTDDMTDYMSSPTRTSCGPSCSVYVTCSTGYTGEMVDGTAP